MPFEAALRRVLRHELERLRNVRHGRRRGRISLRLSRARPLPIAAPIYTLLARVGQRERRVEVDAASVNNASVVNWLP